MDIPPIQMDPYYQTFYASFKSSQQINPNRS